MKKLLVGLARWVLFIYGEDSWELSPLLRDAARVAVEEVESKFKSESGTFKRSQALRVLTNLHPSGRERDFDLAIDWAVRKCTK